MREAVGLAAAVALAVAAGAAVVGARALGARGAWGAVRDLSLWFLAGTGVTSLTYPAWRLLLGRPHGVAYLAFDAAAVAVVCAAAVARRVRRSPGAAGCVGGLPPARAERLAVAAVIAAAALATAAFAVTTAAGPHGEWDAFAIWNARARLMVLEPDARGAFAPGRPGHPDYPLLLPGSVARAWAYAGSEVPLAPAVLAYLFAASGVGALAAGLASLRGRTLGLVGAFLLLGTWDWIRAAPHQYADVPLAAYLVGAFALSAAAERDGAGGRAGLARVGLFLGLAAWVKNEGALLAPCAGAALVAARWRSLRADGVAALAGGALVPVAAVAAFKGWVPSDNYLFARRSLEDVVALATDARRYLAIARAFGAGILSFGKGAATFALAVLLVAGAPLRRLSRSWRAWALGVGLLGYFAAYVLTPLPLREQLDSSLPRLLLQLWPALLFTALHDAAPPALACAPGQAPAGRVDSPAAPAGPVHVEAAGHAAEAEPR